MIVKPEWITIANREISKQQRVQVGFDAAHYFFLVTRKLKLHTKIGRNVAVYIEDILRKKYADE